MHTTKVEIQRLREDFRAEVMAVIDTEKIQQKQIADSVGVNQSSVSRWLGYEGDIDIPASLIPAINKALPELGLHLLRWIANQMGFRVIRQEAIGAVNGNAMDEGITINSILANFLNDLCDGKVHKREARKQLEAIELLVQKAKQEIELMAEER